MRTRKLKALLVAACVLALGAGVFAGMVVSRLPSKSADPKAVDSGLTTDHSELSDELQLSPTQRDQMRVIWEGVRSKVHDTFDEAQLLQKQRDEAIVAILTPEQKEKYAALTQQTAAQFSTLSGQRDAVFRQGVEETKKLLDDAQKEKYDRILCDRIGTVPNGIPGSYSGQTSGNPSPAMVK